MTSAEGVGTQWRFQQSTGHCCNVFIMASEGENHQWRGGHHLRVTWKYLLLIKYGVTFLSFYILDIIDLECKTCLCLKVMYLVIKIISNGRLKKNFGKMEGVDINCRVKIYAGFGCRV